MLVCDEITSALDVSVQAAVLELLAELRRDLGLALLFITHDLGVVASVADRVLVLEHGVVREQGTVADVLERPQDDYTRRLVEAAPPSARGGSLVTRLAARTRLEDVAREAGVAKSTASRILNGTPGMTVRRRRRQRVLDVAAASFATSRMPPLAGSVAPRRVRSGC